MANKQKNSLYQYQKGHAAGLKGLRPEHCNPYNPNHGFSAIGSEAIKAYLDGLKKGYAVYKTKKILLGGGND
jgi:hypothetical protein